MSAPLAGERVTVAQYPKVRIIKKAASESVTNSLVLQDDDDFSVTLDAGKTFEIRLEAIVTGAAAADFKCIWVVTGGVLALTNRHCEGPALAVADATATTMRANGAPALSTTVGYGTDGTNGSNIRENFLVETTTNNTSGTLTLQWAQFALSATATQMNVNSYMVITEVDLI